VVRRMGRPGLAERVVRLEAADRVGEGLEPLVKVPAGHS
jgi:hypothetical protein